jgi:hypothetical protein
LAQIPIFVVARGLIPACERLGPAILLALPKQKKDKVTLVIDQAMKTSQLAMLQATILANQLDLQ